ncbi:O-methyltransferase, partial [Sphingobacterium multivorum]
YYFETIINQVPSGGLILIDNVLWKGKVLDSKPDNQTKQIIDLNARLAQDKRVEKVILPIRDGLFALRKK